MERMYKKLCRKAVFVGLSSETDDEAMNHSNGFMGAQSGNAFRVHTAFLCVWMQRKIEEFTKSFLYKIPALDIMIATRWGHIYEDRED